MSASKYMLCNNLYLISLFRSLLISLTRKKIISHVSQKIIFVSLYYDSNSPSVAKYLGLMYMREELVYRHPCVYASKKKRLIHLKERICFDLSVLARYVGRMSLNLQQLTIYTTIHKRLRTSIRGGRMDPVLLSSIVPSSPMGSKR